jgi:O-methyltransferase
MTLARDSRSYFIFDSFSGFPPMTPHDPLHLQQAFDINYRENSVINSISLFDQAIVIPGFVPETFKRIPREQQFSFVFYDCDLYQPALDTYHFFWDRIQPGGVLIIHDNLATDSGWTGVRKATEEFFAPRNIRFIDFWETTMSIVLKEENQ